MLSVTLATPALSLLQAPHAYANEVDSSILNSNDAFINTIGPRASKIAAEHNLYASVMIAQAIIESGWGHSTLAQAPNYNLFGIKGTYNGNSVNMTTTENSGADAYSTNADFRKYDNYEQSLEDNAKVVGGQYYSGAWKTNTSTYKDATAFLTGRYATATNYAEVLNTTIERYNLTRFDDGAGSGVSSDGEKITVKPDYDLRVKKVKEDVKYSTKKADSLWGIARENVVSIDQLHKWNATLSSTSSSDLAEGTQLKVAEKDVDKEEAYKVINETKEITYKVVPNDTVSKIAESHNLSVEQFRELNPNLNQGNIINVDDVFKIGEEKVTYEKVLTADERKAADAVAKEKEEELNARPVYASDETSVETSVETSFSSQANSYPTGECTWGAKNLAPWAGDYWGNGGDWAASAAKAGFRTGTTPEVGAIAVWQGGYGHVAVVYKVSGNQIAVRESNYAGRRYITDHRGGLFSPGAVTYIYPNK